MRYEVTEKGVYDQDGKRVPVGTEIEVKGDAVPGYLRNKAAPVKGGKVAVTNPAKGALGSDEPKTATEVLAMAGGNFMAFKSAATKLLGNDAPSKKDEIIVALEELATKPE